jgi:hypothetical protein
LFAFFIYFSVFSLFSPSLSAARSDVSLCFATSTRRHVVGVTVRRRRNNNNVEPPLLRVGDFNNVCVRLREQLLPFASVCRDPYLRTQNNYGGVVEPVACVCRGPYLRVDPLRLGG